MIEKTDNSYQFTMDYSTAGTNVSNMGNTEIEKTFTGSQIETDVSPAKKLPTVHNNNPTKTQISLVGRAVHRQLRGDL